MAAENGHGVSFSRLPDGPLAEAIESGTTATASSGALAAEKCGTRLAGMAISSPVAGLRPVRAQRLFDAELAEARQGHFAAFDQLGANDVGGGLEHGLDGFLWIRRRRWRR